MIAELRARFRWLRRKAKGWKTVILGAVAATPLAVFELIEQLKLVDPATILPEPWGQRVALFLAVAMILMRLITKGPVGAKGDDEPDQDTKAGD